MKVFLGGGAYAITLEVFPELLSMVLCITSIVFSHKTMAVANTRGWSSGCLQITVRGSNWCIRNMLIAVLHFPA